MSLSSAGGVTPARAPRPATAARSTLAERAVAKLLAAMLKRGSPVDRATTAHALMATGSSLAVDVYGERHAAILVQTLADHMTAKARLSGELPPLPGEVLQ